MPLVCLWRYRILGLFLCSGPVFRPVSYYRKRGRRLPTGAGALEKEQGFERDAADGRLHIGHYFGALQIGCAATE